MAMSSPNVIMVHDGEQPYVALAKEQARKFGNIVEHRGSLEPLAGMTAFEDSYVQMSSYSRAFDMGCFKRFFIIRQVMVEKDLDSLFHIDSDVLLFEDLRRFEQDILKPAGVACGLHMPRHQPSMRMSFGAHTSYWTRPAIEDFCDFLGRIYRDLPSEVHDKWRWHQDNKVSGGICDMTMQYLWARNRNDVTNFAAPIADGVFDFNVNTGENLVPDEYRTRFGKKAVFFRNGLPFCDATDGSSARRFRSLHFQGSAKSQMARMSLGKRFTLRWLLEESTRPALHKVRTALGSRA